MAPPSPPPPPPPPPRCGAGDRACRLRLPCILQHRRHCRRRGGRRRAVVTAAAYAACSCPAYPSTAQVWQTLNIGNSPRVPNNLIISGAVNGQLPGHCLGVVCQTLPVLRYSRDTASQLAWPACRVQMSCASVRCCVLSPGAAYRWWLVRRGNRVLRALLFVVLRCPSWCCSRGLWWVVCFCSCSLGACVALLLILSELAVPARMPRI